MRACIVNDPTYFGGGTRPINRPPAEVDFKRVLLNRPEPLPEEPKLLDALVDDIHGEAKREAEARDANPLFSLE